MVDGAVVRSFLEQLGQTKVMHSNQREIHEVCFDLSEYKFMFNLQSFATGRDLVKMQVCVSAAASEQASR